MGEVIKGLYLANKIFWTSDYMPCRKVNVEHVSGGRVYFETEYPFRDCDLPIEEFKKLFTKESI